VKARRITLSNLDSARCPKPTSAVRRWSDAPRVGMGADRLVAALLLLQQRGRLTAAQLADELEVSVPTARRDLAALSASGIPEIRRRAAVADGNWSGERARI